MNRHQQEKAAARGSGRAVSYSCLLGNEGLLRRGTPVLNEDSSEQTGMGGHHRSGRPGGFKVGKPWV